MKKNRLICSLLIILTILVSSQYISLASKSISELQSEMEKRSAEIKQKEKEIKAKEKEKDAEVEKRIELDLKIGALEDDIDSVTSTIDAKNAEIAEKEKRIGELEELVIENRDVLKQRIRIMYEHGTTSNLEIILKADGFGDLLSRMSLLQEIVDHDQGIINSYINSQKEMEEAKKTIETERDEQIEARKLLQDKQASLEKLQAEKQAVINKLNSDIKALEKEEKEAEEEYQAIMAQIKKAQGSGSVSVKGTGQFVWPSTASKRVTSYYGRREKPNANATSMHRGIDIGAPNGTDVVAIDSGKVIVAGFGKSYGNYVVIDHGNGYTSLYAHNSRLCVSVGDTVTRGQLIAKVGSTGNSTGPHIHLEISKNGTLVDPMSFF